VDAPLLFSSPSYEPLAERLLLASGSRLEPGRLERDRFPDGEAYQRVLSPVRDRPVVLLAGTVDDGETLRAFDLACALVRQGAARFTWVCPFFGYQTMERAAKSGEVVGAKTRARLLSAVPSAPLGNEVVLVDLHAEGIPHYFGDGMSAYHVYAKKLALEAAKALGGDRLVLASPDAGRAAWVRSLADELGVETAFVAKRRLSGARTEVTGVDAGQVKDRQVVIFDDMVRTGGTLVEAARVFRDRGAAAVHAVTTHLVLPGESLAKIVASGAITTVAGTDTHPRAMALEGRPGLRVASVAPLLAAWLAGEGDFDVARR